MKCVLRSKFGNFRRGDIIDLPEHEVKSLASHGVVRPIGRDHHNQLEKFGRFLQAVARKDTTTLAAEHGSLEVKSYEQIQQKAPMGTLSGVGGGYTVPVEYTDILYYPFTGSARPRSVIFPMSSRSLVIPTVDPTIVPTPGTSGFWGGVSVQWGEEPNLPESEPSFAAVELIAHELTAWAKLSRSLQNDASALAITLGNVFMQSVGYTEDACFLTGNGVAKPQGALTSGAAISVIRNTANKFLAVDAATMISKLPPGWENRLDRLCWHVHPSVYNQIFTLVSVAAVANPHLALVNGRIEIMGIPCYSQDAMSPLGTARDVGLVDWSFYAIGDRELLDVAHSLEAPQVLNTNQAAWRFVCRVDGQPWVRRPLTLQDGVTTCSPFIYLT